MPDRGDFKPRNAAPFLSNILLLDAPGDRNALRIRTPGQMFQNGVPYKLAGTDILDFYPEQYRADAVESCRIMMNKPCGLWQITPVHSDGCVHALEVTAFPISSVFDSASLIMMYLLPLAEPLPISTVQPRANAADTAIEFRFLDIGAGQPQWPVAA